ncbi:MAG: hypothetical protein ABI068_07185 [Ktedonobacterales bacterium]
MFGYAGLTLWDIWQQGANNWDSLWGALNFNTLYLLTIGVNIVSVTLPGASLRSDFLALRRAAVVGDEQLALLAQQQPAHYPGYEQPIGPTRLASVFYLNQRGIARAQGVGVVLGLIFGPIFLALAALFAGDQETYDLLRDVSRKPASAASDPAASEGQRRLAERLEKRIAQRAD